MIVLKYISTNHIGGRHLIVDMGTFAAVSTFEPGDELNTVVFKLRRLAADLEVLAKVDRLPAVYPDTKPT